MSSAGNNQTENGGAPILVAITIPNNTGNGAKLADLIRAVAGASVPTASLVIGAQAPGTDPTVDRGAFVVASPRPNGIAPVASDFTTNGKPVPAGVEFYLPSVQSSELWVRSTSAATVQALAILLP